ncbi:MULTISPECIES: ribosome biogenesis GTP-binding protein YihA/YsxC [Aerococcus]|uniref:Probable GTP-binding protein EngB n=1 Tax=Aerococcus sanguinicola TaxID=119206 RepID=A0A5N1GL55_9LACT|nr:MULTISPECIES: ribosome biogenesis GTP-binding protein YihA/YsxC [Aerococcus]KAA9301715.1 YihA family ribosome biogenesis GTP-binding protein [Aerococcus sanguinicola]MDK6368872.1 ribosome biogenesis GTP-binding protein YihA/YsxC [Aerococcus sp. UMB9870]MDK6680210.1 ribosome biogenesis GTP-binding protein YihA/YsxC [Aerococcus sp. UMB8608]MDK6685685.1 ribosome biogenesis GTP-binding protein YihA/YsxC [Aerococcus sp. UMB8623]MDK6940412.1 ribosome biogenesis GTP-binding protein YihA/YsxC [Aero
MQVHQVEFLISAVRPDQYPEADRPEIALAGRSNVGKSSFINTMVRRKNIARTSSKPGKTQQLNYYAVEDSLYFVDVPGYGYARVSKSEKKKWRDMLDQYFMTRPNLVMALLLVDFRHAPSKEDIQMKDFFETYEIPYFVIATKSDKVKRSQWNKHLAQIKQDLDLVTEDQILPFSSKTAEAKDEAWEIIEDVIAGAYDD